MAQQLTCWNCGQSLDDLPRPISRHANCPACYEVVHCCRMCRWYAPGKPGDCDHDRAEPPVEKESANFCDYFSPAFGRGRATDPDRQDEARSKLDSLFGEEAADTPGDGGGHDQDDDLRSKLDDLFKD